MKKKAFTLLEIMIVIFLIGLIGSIIGYNMKGSLDKGRAFKTEQSMARIQDLLELEIARGASIEAINTDPVAFLEGTGLIKNAKQLAKDGWKKKMKITVDVSGDVTITSPRLTAYKEKLGLHYDYEEEEEEEKSEG